MAQRLVERPVRRSPGRQRSHGLLVRYRVTPWWFRVFVVWGLSRIITTLLLQVFAFWQPANPWTAAHPDYLSFAQFWDSTWYHIVAVSGYPRTLPVDAAGHVQQNAWAFLPAYPVVVRGLMVVTSLPWDFVSVVVSFAFSLAAALVFFLMMRRVLPQSTALFSVVLFCVAPLSPILQVSYAESMFLFLLMLALLLLMSRRYALMIPVIAVAAFTRPSGLALALALGLHIVHRFLTRAGDPFPVRERVLALTATAFSVLAGVAWPLIAWGATGDLNAYTDTELAWRADYIGYQNLLPFAAWVQGAGFWGALLQIGPLAFVLLGLLLVGFAALLFIPPVRRLGVDLRLWSASYGVYLLAVFFPQSSTFRLLMPMFPLLGAAAQRRSRNLWSIASRSSR